MSSEVVFDGRSLRADLHPEHAEPVLLRELHGPPNVALPPGGYSFCWECRSDLPTGGRCTTPAAYAALTSCADENLFRSPCCPLDLSDELRRRRTRRAAVTSLPLPQEPRCRWPFRLWRNKEK